MSSTPLPESSASLRGQLVHVDEQIADLRRRALDLEARLGDALEREARDTLRSPAPGDEDTTDDGGEA